jgi:hypothetical protein
MQADRPEVGAPLAAQRRGGELGNQTSTRWESR